MSAENHTLTSSQRLTLATSAAVMALASTMLACPLFDLGASARCALWFSAESIGVLALAILLEDALRPGAQALLSQLRSAPRPIEAAPA